MITRPRWRLPDWLALHRGPNGHLGRSLPGPNNEGGHLTRCDVGFEPPPVFDCETADSVSVTLAGFNGNSCTDCIPDRSANYTNGRNVDGTYSVPFDEMLGDNCVFRLDIADAGPFVTFNTFLEESCTNLNNQVDIGGDLEFLISISSITQLVTNVVIVGGEIPFVSAFFVIFVIASGPHDLGDTINNSLICQAPFDEVQPWDSGTAVVNQE